MRGHSQVRVLMLGWEYPPRYAGGLGKACRGLSQAMARQNARVFFVLPTFPDRISEKTLEVVGAREMLMEAGWTEALVSHASERWVEVNRGVEAIPGWTVLRTDAQLFPYGAHPSGPAPETLFGGGGGAPSGTESGVRFGAHSEAKTFERVSETTTNTQTVAKPLAAAAKSAGADPGIEPDVNTPSSTRPKASAEIYGRNLWSEIERYCFAVRQLAETHEVDAVHAHDWMTFPAAFEFQRVTGAPVFLHVHATEYDRSGENVHSEVFKIEREGFRRATHIFAVSRYTAGVIEKLYGINRKKISVVYNAPDDEAKDLAKAPDAPRQPDVVFLGRLTFQKGPDHFLRAAALVCQANHDARFVFCGTGDMFDQLRALAHDLGIEHRVHFAGFVDPKGVDQILQNSSVLVMPSVSEPFGLVALEAIHCGIPIIVSKQSGVREVVSRALQVDFWDHDKLADQILGALRLKDLSTQLVHDGLEQVRSLSWESSATRVLDQYRKHIGSTYAEANIRTRVGHAPGSGHAHAHDSSAARTTAAKNQNRPAS